MAAEINITGTIKLKMPVTTGMTRSGKQYTKGGFVLQLLDQYNTTVYLEAFGSVVDVLNAYPINGHVTVIGHVTSREYQGKYYTNVIADNIYQAQGGYLDICHQQPQSYQPQQPQQYQQPTQYQQPYPPQPQQLSPSMQQAQQVAEQAGFEPIEDDLPF